MLHTSDCTLNVPIRAESYVTDLVEIFCGDNLCYPDAQCKVIWSANVYFAVYSEN